MATYDDLLPVARPGLPHVPDIVLKAALARAGVEFFRSTEIWRDTPDRIVAKLNTNQYDFEQPDGARIERVMSMQLGNSPVAQMLPEEFMRLDPTAVGAPQFFCISAVDYSFKVWPMPDASSAGLFFTMFVVIVPLRSSTDAEIPDPLLDEWGDAIAAGARAELMRQPHQTWFNPQAAATNEAVYNDRVARARRKQVSGGHTELRVRPRQFV